MQKSNVNIVRVEQWNVGDRRRQFSDNRKVVNKVAVRVAKGKPGAGQFHGATNFRGSVLSD